MNNINPIKVPSNGRNSNNLNGNGTQFNDSPSGSPSENGLSRNFGNGSNETDDL